MSLLLDVLFAAHARSTHHKLALDALEHLEHPTAEAWRTTFLTHYARYLAGAKDPDDRFKDFRNHVLHVRQGMWGGAIKSAKKWYEQAVEEFRRRNWSDGVYSAVVLSHYFTDPVQPFHTHQSEAENNIHRAFEWSTTKSYEDLRNLLNQRFGYPIIQLSEGDDWLEDLMERGARLSNKFYESLIDHYDFYRGSRNPPEGFDEFCRVSLSRLVGWATVGYARVLDRLFEEANVVPPAQGLTMATFMATLEMPIQWITKKISDSRERALIEQMYAEFQSTGRVDEFLPADDRTIRDLVAAPAKKRTDSETKTREAVVTKTVTETIEEEVSAETSHEQERSYQEASVRQRTAIERTERPKVAASTVRTEQSQSKQPTTGAVTAPAWTVRTESTQTIRSDSRTPLATKLMNAVQSVTEGRSKVVDAKSNDSSSPRESEEEKTSGSSSDLLKVVIPETIEKKSVEAASEIASTVLQQKIEIPSIPPFDFEIPTEPVPAPHVRFEQAATGEVAGPKLQRAVADSEYSEADQTESSESEANVQRLDAAHGGGTVFTTDSVGEQRAVDDEQMETRSESSQERVEFDRFVERSNERSHDEDEDECSSERRGEYDRRESYDLDREPRHDDRDSRSHEHHHDRVRDRDRERHRERERNRQRSFERDRNHERDEDYEEEEREVVAERVPREERARESVPRQERGQREKGPPRYYLEFDSPIVDAPSVGPKTAKRLKGCRIRTVNDLLQADPQSLAASLKTAHLTEQVIRDWQDQARLVCGIPDLRGNDAQLLVACNVRTPQAVAGSEQGSLAQRIERFSKSPAGQRILRNAASPDAEEVAEWIANAQVGRGVQGS